MHHKTVEGIKNALEAGLNLSINTPLCTINKDYVETLKYAHNLGVVYVTCSGLIVTGNAEKEASRRTQLSSEELYEIIKEAKAFCDANGMQMSFTSPGWIEEEKLRALKLNVPTCGACLSNMAITPDGGIVPCQSWLSGESLGNILEDDWEEVWDGDACSKIRAHSAKMDFTCPLRRNTENEE
jgi:MoaA/NifB/PqqE/SkfB family radical SAM enzyme